MTGVAEVPAEWRFEGVWSNLHCVYWPAPASLSPLQQLGLLVIIHHQVLEKHCFTLVNLSSTNELTTTRGLKLKTL